MKSKWEKLIKVLSGMVTLYGALLKMGREKKAALIAADMELIQRFTSEEDVIVLKNAQLEALRQNALNELADGLGREVGDLNISELKKIAPDDVRDSLDECVAELQKITAELAVLTKNNTDLIENALRLINFNIQLLTQDAAVPSYGGSGAEGDGATKNRSIFDRKV